MKPNVLKITFGIFISIGILFFLFPSCEAIKEATQVNVNHDLPDSYFSVDSLSLLKSEKLLFSQTFTVNIDSIIDANGGSLDGVSFYMVQLSVVTPDWITFDWLTSARATITPLGGSPIQVAASTSVNSLTRTVDFVVQNLDVASSVEGPFLLNIYGDLNGPLPAKSIQMLLRSGFKITVNTI